MSMKDRNKIINGLTEYKRNFKQINFVLDACYNALPLGSDVRMVRALLNFVLRNKMYGKKNDKSNLVKDNRIYTNINLSMEDVLLECNSISYAEGKNVKDHVTNWKKVVIRLHDNNIFYFWEFKGSIMFIMERSFSSWIIYNRYGCVVPKTLKKILALAEDMIGCMVGYHRERHIAKCDVENSFGDFLNDMISKMNPSVASLLTLWSEGMKMEEYLNVLRREIDPLEDFEGLREASDFTQRLPLSVNNKICKAESERGVEMSIEIEKKMADELVPKDPNLIKIRKTDKPSKTKKALPSEDSLPKLYSWDAEVNPFKDSREFVRYYHVFLEHCSGGSVKFEDIAVDVRYASEILDVMAENNRKDKVFLNAWLKYFFDNKLKGQKTLKEKYTGVKVFQETFEKFNAAFYVPQ